MKCAPHPDSSPTFVTHTPKQAATGYQPLFHATIARLKAMSVLTDSPGDKH